MSFFSPNFILLLFLLSLLSISCYFPSDISSPMKDPIFCNRKEVPHSAICDPNNLLVKQDKDVVEGLINTMKAAELAVLIINNMSLNYISKFTPVDDKDQIEIASQSFVKKVHDNWGIGDKNKQNGILIFLSVKDRVVYISIGSGLTYKITSSNIQRIIEAMRPDLKSRQHSTALERAIVYIDTYLDNEIESDLKPTWLDWFLSWLPFIIIGSIVAIFIYFASFETEDVRLRRGQDAMRRLVNDVKDADDNKFKATSCPICLEEFTVGSDSTKKPVKVQCGHVFCDLCMKEYLKINTNTRCPICRLPLDGSAPPPVPPPVNNGDNTRPSSNNSSGSQCSSSDDTSSSTSQTYNNNFANNYAYGNNYHQPFFVRHYQDEMLFRMARMHLLYPRVMDQPTYNQMRNANGVNDFRNTADFQISRVNDVITKIVADRAKAAAKGSSGSSRSSFGGGRSGGGGGGRY